VHTDKFRGTYRRRPVFFSRRQARVPPLNPRRARPRDARSVDVPRGPHAHRGGLQRHGRQLRRPHGRDAPARPRRRPRPLPAPPSP